MYKKYKKSSSNDEESFYLLLFLLATDDTLSTKHELYNTHITMNFLSKC